MPLFSIILILKNTRIHVCFLNHHNVTSYVEVSVDKTFSLSTALRVPYVNLDHCYIGFWRCFDNTRAEHENNVIKYIYRLFKEYF